MLPATHIQRVRKQSVIETNSGIELITRNSSRTKNARLAQQNGTLAQACSQAAYNSLLNVEALEQAVRQKPSLIILRASGDEKWQFRIQLKNIRRVLFAANLLVFASMILSYTAWSTIVKIKSLQPEPHKGQQLDALILQDVEPLLAQILPFISRILFTLSNYHLAYYIVFGFITCFFFGGPTDLLCLVLMSPVILVLSLGISSFAALVLYFSIILNEELLLDNANADLHDLISMLKKYGILFSTLSSIASFVQALTSLLPWFVYDLPFQRMLDIEDMVIHDIETRQICSYPRSLTAGKVFINNKEKKSERDDENPKMPKRRPYRTMSSASTVLLQLTKPELRPMHRN